MNIKYFKLVTFLYYSFIIGWGLIDNYDWSDFFPDLFGGGRRSSEMFVIFILPAIIIWGTYFILKDE